MYSPSLKAWCCKVQNSLRDVIPPLHHTWLPQVFPVNRQLHPLSAGNISQSLSAWRWVYCVCVTQLSHSCCLAMWAVNTTTTGISCSPAHRRLPHFGLFALCRAWQQCGVNKMNKTYLNQRPLPWEMSSCRYSLMGKHRDRNLSYSTSKNAAMPIGLFVYHKYTNWQPLYLCVLWMMKMNKRVKVFFI